MLYSVAAPVSKIGSPTCPRRRLPTRDRAAASHARCTRASTRKVHQHQHIPESNNTTTYTPLTNTCRAWTCLVQEEFGGILSEVKRLRGKYPDYHVKCTGHSLGAALAQLTAMSLKDNGITVSTLYNFGQPRIGDANYASCSSSYIPTERVTHLKDTVPHIPYESWGFVHECREAYESTTTTNNPQVGGVYRVHYTVI